MKRLLHLVAVSGALIFLAACSTDSDWIWIAVDGAECRDGSPAGISIRPRAHASDLLIVLGGGPICTDAETCATSGAPLGDSTRFHPSTDMFTDRPENPFMQWNQVWVPHCTDDYHVGSARDVSVPGVPGVQQFVGHANMALFLKHIRARFSGVKRVVLSGYSSGGQGVIANFPQVRRAFGSETQMVLFIDSGPPLPGSETRGILPAMLNLWGAGDTMLSECGKSCGKPDDFFVDYFAWLVDTYGDDLDIALSAFMEDPVEMREFGIDREEWATHLESVRKEVLEGSNGSTFYHDSRAHTYVNSMYTITAEGLTVAGWLGLVLDNRPEHVGP